MKIETHYRVEIDLISKSNSALRDGYNKYSQSVYEQKRKSTYVANFVKTDMGNLEHFPYEGAVTFTGPVRKDVVAVAAHFIGVIKQFPDISGYPSVEDENV